MFRKIKLKRRIRKCKSTIERIEAKRIRSQSALIQSILMQTSPNDADVDYFNQYTTQIGTLRKEIAANERELAALSGKEKIKD